MQKKVIIIAIQERYLDTITKQVKEILGDKITIHSITVKDLRQNTINSGDIVLISNSQIKGLVNQLIPVNCPIIIAKRDINYTNIRTLIDLPPGQKILVVNDNKQNTEETVRSLREIVFEHEYQAYDPEVPISSSIDYIVTPGEQHLLPGGLLSVIDVGPRLLDLSTFEEIKELLGLEYPKTQIVKRYLKACVSLSRYDRVKTGNSKDIRNVAQYHFEDIIAISDSVRRAVDIAKKYAVDDTIAQIYIEGEKGTGKSMFAQAIHNYSNSSELPFILINCISKPFDILEKELFGYEEEGEVSQGVFELANNGTVCINGVSELPLSTQKRLFDMLVSRSFTRISGNEVIHLQARVIVTNYKNSESLLEQNLFDEKLYHLLMKTSVNVPSLSERMEDFIPLIENMKQRINRTDIKFTDEVISYLKSYKWVGNVKELYNVITYLSFLEDSPIQLDSLPFYLRSNAKKEESNKVDVQREIISKIEEHGFLDESIEILSTFIEGKKVHTSYGRKALKKCLEEKGLNISEQQLRMRLEVLHDIGLTIVRQGRAGSTISRKGEAFIKEYKKNAAITEAKEVINTIE
ncbi:sigma 54-interacting transcriptional regulator [Virgibacillus halodenitrificans]|uniref:sigma 54-interacting transcriptional regulator n=1 Tax=Virgibacillus halodenitrificans TaxID=1482 RepID=UPI002DB9A1DC|nr:sigma 54-interacting transcriptional regulator [Virgibacillus halodenitrificans]MEC2159666.1 sigma 54-interacting transcriptional regulator [Virgibacillus halodenitrificans]